MKDLTKENQAEANMFYSKALKNADGSPLKARRSGKTKTWKTRPNEFRIPVKYGFKHSFYITQNNCQGWQIKDVLDEGREYHITIVKE